MHAVFSEKDPGVVAFPRVDRFRNLRDSVECDIVSQVADCVQVHEEINLGLLSRHGGPYLGMSVYALLHIPFSPILSIRPASYLYMCV